jgi:hypothetical protein
MKVLVGAVREPPLRVDFHGKVNCGDPVPGSQGDPNPCLSRRWPDTGAFFRLSPGRLDFEQDWSMINHPLTASIPMSNQKTIFVILSAAKNLSFEAAEIRNEAALRSE